MWGTGADGGRGTRKVAGGLLRTTAMVHAGDNDGEGALGMESSGPVWMVFRKRNCQVSVTLRMWRDAARGRVASA